MMSAAQAGAQIRALREGASTLEAAQDYIRQQAELTEAKTRMFLGAATLTFSRREYVLEQ